MRLCGNAGSGGRHRHGEGANRADVEGRVRRRAGHRRRSEREGGTVRRHTNKRRSRAVISHNRVRKGHRRGAAGRQVGREVGRAGDGRRLGVADGDGEGAGVGEADGIRRGAGDDGGTFRKSRTAGRTASHQNAGAIIRGARNRPHDVGLGAYAEVGVAGNVHRTRADHRGFSVTDGDGERAGVGEADSIRGGAGDDGGTCVEGAAAGRNANHGGRNRAVVRRGRIDPRDVRLRAQAGVGVAGDVQRARANDGCGHIQNGVDGGVGVVEQVGVDLGGGDGDHVGQLRIARGRGHDDGGTSAGVRDQRADHTGDDTKRLGASGGTGHESDAGRQHISQGHGAAVVGAGVGDAEGVSDVGAGAHGEGRARLGDGEVSRLRERRGRAHGGEQGAGAAQGEQRFAG